MEKAKRDVHTDGKDLQKGELKGGEEAGSISGSETFTTGVIGIDYTAADYLKQRRVKFTRNEDVLKATCVVCRVKGKTLRVNNELGNFSCGGCGASGSFGNLRKKLGDIPVSSVSSSTSLQFEVYVPPFRTLGYSVKYTRALGKDKSSHLFLNGIGISLDLAKRLKLGVTDTGAITWPFMYTRNRSSVSYLTIRDELGNWVKLDGDPKTCAWFGQQFFKLGNDEAFICQTPLDATVLMSVGEKNVLAPPQDNELPHLRSHQLALLERCSLVYLVPNPTEEGQRWAIRLQSEIGRWRTRIIQMDYRPCQIVELDLGDQWIEGKRKSVSSLGAAVRKAREMIGEMDFAFENRDNLSGLPVRLEPIDKLLGGWRPGEVTVISGEPGVGKSTFCSFLSLLQASDGVPVLHFTFEVAPFAIMKKWMSMLGGVTFSTLDRRSYVVARKKLAKRPLYIPQTYGICELPEVRRAVYDSCTRHGVKFLVLDHLGFLSMMGQDASNDIKTTGTIMREIKRWSLDLKIHIILVHHLRKKLQGQRASSGISELRGSGEVGQLADNVMILKRSSNNDEMVVSLHKVRDDSGYEGNVRLRFNSESLVYLP